MPTALPDMLFLTGHVELRTPVAVDEVLRRIRGLSSRRTAPAGDVGPTTMRLREVDSAHGHTFRLTMTPRFRTMYLPVVSVECVADGEGSIVRLAAGPKWQEMGWLGLLFVGVEWMTYSHTGGASLSLPAVLVIGHVVASSRVFWPVWRAVVKAVETSIRGDTAPRPADQS